MKKTYEISLEACAVAIECESMPLTARLATSLRRAMRWYCNQAASASTLTPTGMIPCKA